VEREVMSVITAAEWLQYGFVGYYIDLMLSVDSHYLNDPLPRTLFFLRKKGANRRLL
jgi:hypothetical protein